MEPIFAAIERGEDPFPDDPAPAASAATDESLYSPVNSSGEGTPGTAEAAPTPADPSAAGDDGLSLPPRAQASGGEGGERSEPGGGLLHAIDSERDETEAPPTPDPSPPRFAREEGNPEITGAAAAGDDGLYSPVNSEASDAKAPAWEQRPALPDGSRLVAALQTADGGRAPLFINPE